jgi:hypothetical protein
MIHGTNRIATDHKETCIDQSKKRAYPSYLASPDNTLCQKVGEVVKDRIPPKPGMAMNDKWIVLRKTSTTPAFLVFIDQEMISFETKATMSKTVLIFHWQSFFIAHLHSTPL